MIIKEKFRVFLENLGVRGKICNILFKKMYVRKIFFVICPEKCFSSPFLYISGKMFWFMSEKKCRRGGGGGGGEENFNHENKI